VRTHDGTYFRASLGGIYGQAKTEALGITIDYTGGGWLLDLAVGGTIENMVSIGGTLLLGEISSPDVEVRGSNEPVEADGDMGVVLLGPFVDVFFGPESGGHIGAVLGAASLGLADENDEPSSGYGVGVFGGYDFWIADQWALGINLRYLYAKGEREFSLLDERVDDSANIYGVAFTALHH